ncbi:MAG: thiol peroxidase [Aliifodinibius sp.]|nr:thiol peroxidase [Fodinibius sp.]
MVKERFGLLNVGGTDVTILGEDVIVGQKAPEFRAQSLNWELIKVLDSTREKVRIIAALPSLETGVCDRETRRFNEEAAKLDENIVIIPISTDLPYTQSRWCAAAGIDQVMVVSDHMETSFGLNYGCLIKERRILRRAVFIIDLEDKVRYVDYMATLGDEPDYAEVIAQAKNVLS